MEKVNVVILAEEVQYRVKVKNKIVSEDVAIVGYSDFKEESKLKIEGYFPDVIVCALDNSDIDEDFYKFIQSVQFQNSGTAVVIMTDKVSISLVNEAAKRGIRQVFDFSVDAEEFTAALGEVNEIEQRLMGQLKIEKRVRAKVIAFYGVKGGVGTTSIVTNVAAALASRGKKVILLDFDLQYGDSNLFLDVDSKDTIVELARDPEGISIEKVNAATATHSTGFSILCPPKTPEYADYITPEHTRKIIENVRPYFEYILIDMGTNFAETTLVALENCDEIQVITNLNVPCLKGTKAVMNVLDTLRVADKAKLVIAKNRSSLIKIKDFENLMLRKAYATITSDRNISDNAMNSGNPVVLNSPRSAIAKDYNKYVDQIVADKDNI
ncbi:MAG: CpaE family protein [Eubacterium sp.]